MPQAEKPLTSEEIQTRLKTLPAWEIVDGKLRREFRFANFVEAFGFMTQVALLAEAMNHHPDWCNAYRVVRVDLVTHDAGGITEKDFALAAKMDALAHGRTQD